MSHQRLRRPRPQPTSAQPSAEAQQPGASPISLNHSFGAVPLHGLPIQAKLTVGAADDAYEREADHVADQVMSAPEAEEQAAISPLEAGGLRTSREEAAGSFEAGAGFEQQLGAAGGGSPLPDATRAFMEPRFGADFSGVRLHTGGEAAQLSRQVSAQAFTHGSDIYMGEGHTNIGSGDGQRLLAHELTHVVQQTGGVARKPVVQRKLGGELGQITQDGLKAKLTGRGIALPFRNLRELFNAVQSADQTLTSIDDVLRAFSGKHGLPAFSGSAEAAPNAQVDAEQPEQQAQSAEEKRPEEEKQSAPPLAAIAKASEEAQQEAQQEVAERAPVESRAGSSMKRQEEPEQATSAAMQPRRFGRRGKQAKQHKTVGQGGSKMIVNYVWLGNAALGPLEKFNIYSWKALGHTVNIYTHTFGGQAPHTEDSLGLEAGDATVIDLRASLNADNAAAQETPKAMLSDARSILQRWLAAVPQNGKPGTDHIYNMVDLTKSYIGGTQQGIVLDMKVGPSVHLQDYAESFNDKLISYTRGGNTAGVPENQSIGTMQETDDLRKAYATNFNNKIQNLASESHTSAWFNSITRYHGQSYQQTRKWLDVATQSPSGDPIRGREFAVSEIGPESSGPFRVFKRATDQSNKAGLKTKPEEVESLAKDTWEKELASIEALDPELQHFFQKAKIAMEQLGAK